MQKVEGSNPFSRFFAIPLHAGGLVPALAAETRSNHPRISPPFQALVVVPHNVVHPGLLEGWGCRATTATITGQQRNALYEQVRNHLGALNDIWIAMECKQDFATAERLGIEFSEDFRLLEDLGWDPRDSRQEVELTMPPEELTEILRRLRSEAEGGLAEAEEDRKSSRKEEENHRELPGHEGHLRRADGEA